MYGEHWTRPERGKCDGSNIKIVKLIFDAFAIVAMIKLMRCGMHLLRHKFGWALFNAMTQQPVTAITVVFHYFVSEITSHNTNIHIQLLGAFCIWQVHKIQNYQRNSSLLVTCHSLGTAVRCLSSFSVIFFLFLFSCFSKTKRKKAREKMGSAYKRWTASWCSKLHFKLFETLSEGEVKE